MINCGLPPGTPEAPASGTPFDADKPVLIFDGDCGLCRQWISRWRQLTRGAVEYVASQNPAVQQQYTQVPAQWYKEGVVLMEPGQPPVRSAHAVLRTLALAPGGTGFLYWLYGHFPPFAWAAELGYSLIARHRNSAGALTKIVWFNRVQLPRLALTRWIFLRALGVIYFIAFVSLGVQIRGLVGEHGILPATQFLDEAAAQLGGSKWIQLPGLFWITGAGDAALQAMWIAGAICAVLLILGVGQVPMLLALWALYLSLCGMGQDFLQFQWDLLLLESGFLAIFVAPLTLSPRAPLNEGEPPRLAIWMLRWLAARLMFQSGIVKLLSHDPTWRDLTALTYHYETQPLPTILGWFAHHSPLWLLRVETLAMYGIELAMAALVFFPRGLRIIAAAAFALLQVGILLTGNYGFFNWLSIALCIPLLDDFVWPWRWGGKRLLVDPNRDAESPRQHWPRFILYPVAAIVFLVTGTEALMQLGWTRILPQPAIALAQAAQPFRTLNSYGLFAVMTTTRPEITIEGSNDGQNWRPYLFKYKPNELNRRPICCQPHMPRLDWQMWFAALGTWRRDPWIILFQQRLLEGTPQVLALLRSNPFPDSPPKFVRATVADYHFSDTATWRRTGQWWRADEPQPYSPVLTLRDGKLSAATDSAID